MSGVSPAIIGLISVVACVIVVTITIFAVQAYDKSHMPPATHCDAGYSCQLTAAPPATSSFIGCFNLAAGSNPPVGFTWDFKANVNFVGNTVSSAQAIAQAVAVPSFAASNWSYIGFVASEHQKSPKVSLYVCGGHEPPSSAALASTSCSNMFSDGQPFGCKGDSGLPGVCNTVAVYKIN